MLYVLGVGSAAVGTWSTYHYVASPGQLTAVVAVAAALVTLGLCWPGPRAHGAAGRSRQAPPAWSVGLLAALGTSLLVVAPQVPDAVGSTALFLGIEGAAGMVITIWSRRRGWGDRHVLGLAAAALFAYGWRSFLATPAFDAAPIELVRISNVTFAALALAAVLIAMPRTGQQHSTRTTMAVSGPSTGAL